jgi:hypothetical protein
LHSGSLLASQARERLNQSQFLNPRSVLATRRVHRRKT